MDCSRTALSGGTLKARPIGRRAHGTLAWETPVSQPIQYGAAPPTAPAQLLLWLKPVRFSPSALWATKW